MTFPLRSPWYYLTWRPSHMPAEHEVAMARMTRRRGIHGMLMLHWAIYPPYEDDSEHGLWTALEIIFAFHYVGVVAGLGALIGWLIPDSNLWIPSLVLASLWGLCLLYGTATYLGWLFWLQRRWPGDLS